MDYPLLSELRDLVALYASTSESKEVSSIKAFLQPFAHLVGEHTFSCSDVFELTLLLAPDSQEPLIVAIKATLSSNPIYQMLTQADEPKQKALTVLHQESLLNSTLVSALNRKEKLDQMILQLADKQLLRDNVGLIQSIAENHIDFMQVHLIIHYLLKCNLLQTEFIRACTEDVNHRRYILTKMFVHLNKHSIVINAAQLKVILNLSLNKVRRICDVITQYMEYTLGKNMESSSLDTILQRITTKLPKVKETTIKASDKILVNSRKELRCELEIDKGLHFFVEPGAIVYTRGKKINKVFDTLEATAPSYSLKTYTDPSPKKTSKETRVNQLLGRPSWYTVNKVVTQWQSQTCLTLTEDAVLQHMSLEDRFECLLDGLKQLNQLHEANITVGDIKPDNCVVDPDKKTLKLIDFENSHYHASSKDFFSTLVYNEATDNDFSPNVFPYDVGAMVTVMWRLFPEHYKILFGVPAKVRVISKLDLNNPLLAALATLEAAMRKQEIDQRCTSADTVKFCQSVLEHRRSQTLTVTKVEEIAQQTLNRPDRTVEDALRHRGRFRP